MKDYFDPETLSRLMSAVAARRRRVSKPCEVCGKPMENVLQKRRYCGPTCRQKASRRRRLNPPA